MESQLLQPVKISTHGVQRLTFLDGLRGLACAAVVLYHYAKHEHLNTGIGMLWNLGAYGVHFFFLISGFVITLSIERYRSNLISFLKSRAIRIYPTYALSVFFSWCFLVLFKPDYAVPIVDAMKNLLFFHRPFGIAHIDPAYWTLMQEWIFYIWMAVFALLSQKLKLPLLSFSVAMLLGLTGLSLLEQGNILLLGKTVKLIILYEYFYLFAAGIFLYRFHQKRLSKLATVAGLALCLLDFKLQVHLAKPQFAFSSEIEGWIVIGMVGFLLVCCSHVWLREALSQPLLVFLGFISYPLYLIHNRAGEAMLGNLKLLGLPSVLRIAVAIAIFVTISWAITVYYDEPARKWFRQRLLKSRAGLL